MKRLCLIQLLVVDGKTETIEGNGSTIKFGKLIFNSKETKYYQVQKYVTVDNHVYAVSAMVINDKFYQSLPDDLKKVIDNAQKLALAVNRGVSRYTDHMAIDNLKANGMEVYFPTAAERKAFKDTAQAPVVKWLRKESGDKWVDGMLQAAEDAK